MSTDTTRATRTERFVATYPGSGRPTSHVCHNDHEYRPPDEPGWVATYEGRDAACCHNTTDGYTTPDSPEEIDAAFLRGEHRQIGHPEPVDGCTLCEQYQPMPATRAAAPTHTATPWKVDFTDHNEYDEPCVHIVDATGNSVVATAFWPMKREQEVQALAELIVRAVNSHEQLLDLCKAVLRRLDLEAEERGEAALFPCAALRGDLRAAIARAEGRE